MIALAVAESAVTSVVITQCQAAILIFGFRGALGVTALNHWISLDLGSTPAGWTRSPWPFQGPE